MDLILALIRPSHKHQESGARLSPSQISLRDQVRPLIKALDVVVRQSNAKSPMPKLLDHVRQQEFLKFHLILQCEARQLRLQQLVFHMLGLQVQLTRNFQSMKERKLNLMHDTNQQVQFWLLAL